MVVLVLGDLLLGVLLRAMIVLTLLVLCLGTMVPIGTIDAWPVPTLSLVVWSNINWC
jgi:hypothetical protein